MGQDEAPGDEMLPRPEEADELIAHLAALVAARGPGPLVSGVIVEPTSRYFPDPWSPTMEGVERLARRLLVYAGLADLELVIADGPPAHGVGLGACLLGAVDLPIRSLGLDGQPLVLLVDDRRLDDSERAAACLCHAVAHAYRVHHHLTLTALSAGTYREASARPWSAEALEERLTDVTAFYLGFGVIVANGALTQRTSEERSGPYSYLTLSPSVKVTTTRVGSLGPHAASYLLAAQAVARGLDAHTKKRLAGHLETNQAAFFEAACAALSAHGEEREGAEAAGGTGVLRARLGVPARSMWPPPPDLSALTAPLAPLPGARVVRRRRDGKPVFRRPTDPINQAVVYAWLCAMVPGLMYPMLRPGKALMIAATAIGAMVGFVGGYVFGRRRRGWRCSACRATLTVVDERCPRCGGRVSA